MAEYSASGIHMATAQQRLTNNSSSPVAAAYMSEENQHLLYRSIVRQVYKLTAGNVTMGPISLPDMQAIMLTVMDDRLSLAELNKKAMAYAVQIAMNNIASYLGYLRQISANSSGERTDLASVLRPRDTRSYKELPGRTII